MMIREDINNEFMGSFREVFRPCILPIFHRYPYRTYKVSKVRTKMFHGMRMSVRSFRRRKDRQRHLSQHQQRKYLHSHRIPF